MEKILILGGTGAMGVYTVPYIVEKGYKVDVVSMDDIKSDNENLRYIVANAKDPEWLEGFLKEEKYDAIIDFMLYYEEGLFEKVYNLFLENTKHYVFLSTYRVYSSDELPIKETSPRQLEASKDEYYLSLEKKEYALYKARQEDLLRNSGKNNYTIVRPAITFSKTRFQLTTLEANVLVYRALNNKTVVLPKQAMNIEATMTWAGDVAKMFGAVLLNPKAMGEAYTFATAEHHTWAEIAEYYKELIGLKYVTVDTDAYVEIMGGSHIAKHQLIYDRCIDRVVDNSKILELAGLKQEDLTPIFDALKRELANLPKDYKWPENDINKRMDKYLEENGIQ